jgi:Tol biopolymer transport system component
MMIKNLNHLGVMLAVAAGTLVAGGVLLLMLLVVVEPAGAAFPGKNGKIVFSSKHSPGGFDGSTDYEIYTVNSNGTGLDRLTKNTWNDREPAWSPDTPPLPGGNQIAFTSDRDGDYEIYTMNPTLAQLGPNGLIFIPTVRLTNNSAWDLQPAWSPDGNKIAFASNRDDGQLSPTGECEGSGSCNWNIYTINADGTGLDRLTNDPAQDYQPAWSPDGNKIAFTHNGGGAGTGGIYTMNANEFGGPVPLTHNRDTEPDWSPDARKIAFTREFGGGMFSRNKEIYTINANGTGEEDELTTTAALVMDFQPAWSPNGNKIAFTRSQEIYTMNTNGSGEAPLNNGDGVSGQELDWQPLREPLVFPPFRRPQP